MKTKEKPSTKQCPKCGNTMLLRLYSLNVKVCTDCNITIPWYLDKDQKSVI